jgi:putative DNA primase/helicase
VAFSPDGRRLVAGDTAGRLNVWDPHSGQELLSLKAHSNQLLSVAFSSDGRRLVTASWDGTAKVWDSGSSQEPLALRGHTDGVQEVAFSPDGRRLATAGQDRTARVWDAGTGRELFLLSGHTGPVESLGFSADGRLIATGSSDRTARVWDALTGEPRRTFPGHTSPVWGVALSPDGRYLATACGDGSGTGGTAKVWDGHTGRGLFALVHTKDVRSVAFSADGRRLSTTTPDGTKVWDLQTRQEVNDPDAAQFLFAAGDPALSPDHRVLARPEGDIVYLHDLKQPVDADELAFREAQARPDPVWHEEQAARCEQAGQWFAAVFHFDQALAARPAEPLHLRRGRARAELARAEPGRWEDARADFARAVDQQPDEPDAWRGLALTQLMLNQPDAYRQTCARFLDRFAFPPEAVAAGVAFGPAADDPFTRAALARSADPLLAARRSAARAAVLRLDAVPDPARLLVWAGGDPVARGAVLCRAGRHAEAVQALAGAVGKKVGIRPKRQDDWLVVPNLWGAVIGRPGIMKSPAIGQPYKFLYRLQSEAQRRHEQELREYDEQCLIAEVRKKQKRKAIEDAVSKKKDPFQAAKQFAIDEPEEPTPQRYVVNDSTVEKLGVLLNQNPNGLTVFRDELMGLLRQLDKEGQEGARAFYLEAWDGLGTYTYDRIIRGTLNIDSVTLSIMGGIQPGRLLDYLGGALKGGADDDGLLQRFQMMVYPDVARGWRNVDRWPDSVAKEMAWEVFQRLDALDPAAVGAAADDGGDGVPFLRFAPDAQDLFDGWRAGLEAKVRSGDEHPALESHLAKYRSLVPSLALLTHLADGARGPVGAAATRRAIGWAAYLESHARRVYGIALNSASVAGKALAKCIAKGELTDGFTLRELYRKHWAGLSEKPAVEQAVDLLLDLGWLKEEVMVTGGRTKTCYRINPAALLTKAAAAPGARSAKGPAGTPSGTNGTGPPAPVQARAGGADGDDAWEDV